MPIISNVRRILAAVDLEEVVEALARANVLDCASESPHERRTQLYDLFGMLRDVSSNKNFATQTIVARAVAKVPRKLLPKILEVVSALMVTPNFELE